jgi:integrase
VPLPQPLIDAIRRYLKCRGDHARTAVPDARESWCASERRLETRSVLRIVRELGQRVGLHVWCHALRHAAITTAIEHGQKDGLGLDQIRHFSRHRTLVTMLIYRDEHDKAAAQKTLADVVVQTLTR